jgi:hypothetical protein
MNTTNLFVELVVIGTGVSLWVLMLAGSAFGYAWIPADSPWMAVFALPALAVTYVLGIVWDRIADLLFERVWAERLLAAHFQSRDDYYNARRLILLKAPPLSELLEYGRSRLRICRGWTLNSAMLGISLNLLLWTRYPDGQDAWALSLLGTMAATTLAIGAWFAWRNLSAAEYRKIRDQSVYLLAEQGSINRA